LRDLRELANSRSISRLDLGQDCSASLSKHFFNGLLGERQLFSGSEKADVLVALCSEALDALGGEITEGGVVLSDVEAHGHAVRIAFTETAKSLVNAPRMAGAVAAGALFALLGCDIEALCSHIGEHFAKRGEDVVRDNVACARKGHELGSALDVSIESPSPAGAPTNLLSGSATVAVAAATGIRLANHELDVVVTSGDGDMYGEGGNHLLHAVRRNIAVTAFVHDNQVYGLTKGQASPTSDPGFVTKIQTHGVVLARMNPLALAIVGDCPFVARSFSGDHDHLLEMMKAALKHDGGFALVDILQPCVSFNRTNTFKWYRQRVRPVPETHDPFDQASALQLALKWGDEIPIGIIYRSHRPSFESRLGVLERGTLTGQFEETPGEKAGAQ